MVDWNGKLDINVTLAAINNRPVDTDFVYRLMNELTNQQIMTSTAIKAMQFSHKLIKTF